MEDSNLLRKMLHNSGIINLSMAEFKWKMASLLKGIDPEEGYQEIERIKAKHGGDLTAEILLDEARPVNSAFHFYFNWDDKKAAHKYRLIQARELLQNIQVNILSDGEPKKVRVYEVVRRQEGRGVYKNIESLTSDDLEYIRTQVIKALTTYRNKLSVYDHFRQSVKHLDNGISELEVLEQKKEQVAA